MMHGNIQFKLSCKVSDDNDNTLCVRQMLLWVTAADQKPNPNQSSVMKPVITTRHGVLLEAVREMFWYLYET